LKYPTKGRRDGALATTETDKGKLRNQFTKNLSAGGN